MQIGLPGFEASELALVSLVTLEVFPHSPLRQNDRFIANRYLEENSGRLTNLYGNQRSPAQRTGYD